MKFVRKCIAFAFVLIAGGFSFASSLSIQIVQHATAKTRIYETTRVIEDSILNYFFDNGFVVSNSPIALSQIDTDDDEQIFYKSSDEAFYGSVNYFVTVYVDYIDLLASKNPDAVLLSNISKISWKTVDMKTNAEVDSGSGKVKASAASDGAWRVSSFASEVAARIMREIK